MRLDNYLVKRGFFESRNRAQEAIKNSLVIIDNRVVTKSSFRVSSNSLVEVMESKFYISRAAKKLESYISEFKIDFREKSVLDVGSSTGGFTQIALEMGAKSVDCVDVGSNQLHKSLREDSRVRVFEETDIRDFKGNIYDIVISDVSFISLLKIVESIDNLSKDRALITLLFKPQFEVGRGVKRDSKGVVIDRVAIDSAVERFLFKVRELNWRLINRAKSKVSGKEGNIEEFFTFVKEVI